VRVDLGTAPMTVSIFLPPLKIMTVGMERIPYSVAMPGDSSVFSLTYRERRGVMEKKFRRKRKMRIERHMSGGGGGGTGPHGPIHMGLDSLLLSVVFCVPTYHADLLPVLPGDLVDDGRDHAAGAAPGGPEVHQHGHGRVQHQVLKGALGHGPGG
jgi:hypothetical protein